jgi:hypothetical protein
LFVTITFLLILLIYDLLLALLHVCALIFLFFLFRIILHNHVRVLTHNAIVHSVPTYSLGEGYGFRFDLGVHLDVIVINVLLVVNDHDYTFVELG